MDLALLAGALALACNCAFMLPMATGPNAAIFADGGVDLATMSRAGLVMNGIAIVVITLFVFISAPLAFLSV